MQAMTEIFGKSINQRPTGSNSIYKTTFLYTSSCQGDTSFLTGDPFAPQGGPENRSTTAVKPLFDE